MSNDVHARLTKPALSQNLDYCEKGLEGLPFTPYTYDQWGEGWIPEQIKKAVTSLGLKFNPEDTRIHNVHYADVFGHHKDSTISIDSMATQFGKLPIQMRQWVRHVIDVPGDGESAFAWNGNITFVRPNDDMMTVIVHETAHCLDGMGAYHDKPLSSSQYWWDNYNLDPKVPDPYSQTNAVGDVAQTTVVSVFNENVPGGFGSIEPNWHDVFHQYVTVISEANAAGQGNSLFKPGSAIAATHRLRNSVPVPMTDNVHMLNVKKHGAALDVSIKSAVTVMDTDHSDSEPQIGCTLKW